MSRLRIGSARFRITAAVLALVLLLAGCGKGDTDTVKTVVVENGSIDRAAAKTAVTDISGDWYGWWRMYSTSGDWAHMYGYWWDCCAEVKDGSMLLWDEDLPKANFLAEAKLSMHGKDVRCTGGSFIDRELKSGSWDITLSEDDCGTLMTISGKYDAVGKGGFSYEIFLRPWGSKWPEDDEDKLPYYYNDWYLPLIEEGKDMPDVIGSKD